MNPRRGHQPVVVPFGDDDLRVAGLVHCDVAGFEFQRHPCYRGEVPADCLRPSRRVGAGRAKGYSTSASGAYNSSSACHLRCEILLIRNSKTSRGLADSDVMRHSLRCQRLRIGPIFILTTAQVQPSSQPIPSPSPSSP